MDPAKLTAQTLVDDRYVIVERLGAGGMGTVYKAFEKSLNRVVALKFLHSWLLSQDDHLRRFEQEGKILCSLEHANVLRCYRFGIFEEDSPYLAMEFLEGRTLREILDEAQKAMSPADVLRLLIQVCDGVASAHARGILHRDLKPENIFVENGSDNPKILDFGLAKVFQGSDSGQKHTKTGALVGTVQYMSPEQCTGNKADERSDIYAMSCILFECLTLHKAFDADNPVAFLHLHVNAPRPLLAGKFPPGSMQDALQAVLNKGLAVDPSKRYQSMLELKEDLHAISEGQYGKIGAFAQDQEEGLKKKTKLQIAAVSILVIASLIFFLVPFSVVEKQMFFRSPPLPSSIIEKMRKLMTEDRFSAAVLYLPELEKQLQATKNPDDILAAGQLAHDLNLAGKSDYGFKLESDVQSAIAHMVKRKDLDIRDFNKLARLDLQIASRDTKSREYRQAVKRLFAFASQKTYYIDHDLALDLSQRYLALLFEKDNPDPKEVHSALKEKMQALHLKGAPANEVQKAANLVLESCNRLDKDRDSLELVETLTCVADTCDPKTAEKYWQEAVDIQNKYGFSKGKKELYSRVAVNRCLLGKHQEALDYLLESRNMARDDIKDSINIKDMVYKRTSMSKSVGVLQLRLAALIAREYLHLGKTEQSRLELEDALGILRKVVVIPNDAQFSLVDLPHSAEEMFVTAFCLDESEKGEEAYTLVFQRARPVYGENLADYPEDFKKIEHLYRNWLAVRLMYENLLQRKPKGSEWDKIVNLLNEKHLEVIEVERLIVAEPDFKAKFKGLSPDEQSDLLYRTLLKRPAEKGGKEFWADNIRKLDFAEVCRLFLLNGETVAVAHKLVDVDRLVLPGVPESKHK